MKRREFIGLSLAALTVPLLASERRPLKILILGGTGFIGPHQVETALGRGHEVTIFNRGKTAPGLFPQVEQLIGDRDDDLKALEGRKWDAVIDNSGFVPRWVDQSARLLKGHVGHYMYLSSISAYADTSVIGLNENSELRKLDDPKTEDTSGENYGGMKALSEERVRQSFPEASTLVRSGLVVGSGDPTDRFTYWPARMHRGGNVLAPGSPDDPIQCIDVRDLAKWMLIAIEEKHYGTYNVTGPYHQMTMGEFLKTVQESTNSKATINWVPWKFLSSQKVRPWTELPLWVPPNSDLSGFVRIDNSKAIKAGLTFRPMSKTVRDALAWHRTVGKAGRTLKAGLSSEREVRLLGAWQASRAIRF